MTKKQELGEYGEKLVIKKCDCPECKKNKTLKRLPNNFKCVDIICDFCGYLAQVKTKNTSNTMVIPDKILGAAWEPQNERMKSKIYFNLFLVLKNKDKKAESIYYLAAKDQNIKMFEPRKPLSNKAKRAGWQGFIYNLQSVKDRFVCFYNTS